MLRPDDDAVVARLPTRLSKPGWSLTQLTFRLLLVCLPLIVGCGALAQKTWPHVGPLVKAVARPGQTSSSTGALDERFARKVDTVLERLREQGFHPRVVSTWRSADRQELIYQRGRLRQKIWGGAPSTQARAGQSCHNRMDHRRPAGLAADIAPGRHRRTVSEKAAFFRALGREAQAEKLKWGGSWARRNRTWARFDLGWDPGHIQSRRCGRLLRAKATKRSRR